MVDELAGANMLLAGLSPADLEPLRAHLKPVTLELRQMLADQGETVTHVYFVTSGIVSRIGLTLDGRSLELACTGNEGAIGVLDVLGIHRLPCRFVVQYPGTALRIEVAVLRRTLRDGGPLLERVTAYSSVLITQLACSAVCARFHTAEQRLARWLATAVGRIGTTRVPWSHEWIAEMVGGPRSAVSQAAAALRLQGAIERGRGGVTITDVNRLRENACECLGIVDEALARFARACKQSH